jgi:hypothetical protein
MEKINFSLLYIRLRCSRNIQETPSEIIFFLFKIFNEYILN